MATEIRIPNLPGVDFVTLARWLKQPGDAVNVGEELAEVESGKATLAIESPAKGMLDGNVLAANGQSIRCGEPIGSVLSKDESPLGPAPWTGRPELSATTILPVDSARDLAPATMPPAVFSPSVRTAVASPLARRIARENGIDLQSLKGSGPGGRIVKRDAERAIVAQAMPLDGARPGLSRYAGKAIPLDGMRRTMAERLSLSKQTVPHSCLRRDIRLGALIALRAQINGGREAPLAKFTLTDYFIKAAANALLQVPEVNVVWDGDCVLQLESTDISVAVSVEGGLYTPVLRNAGQKSLSSISSELRNLATAARDRRLLATDCEGGAMTISNLGMFGVDSFDAIINPPQSMILAIGRLRDGMSIREDSGNSYSSACATFTLSVDHRVIDGAMAARYLKMLADLLEKPLGTLC